GSHPVVINGNLTINSSGGNNASTDAFFGTNGGIVVVGGNIVVGDASGANLRACAFGSYSGGSPVFILRGNITYNSLGYNNYGGTWIYDGTGTQTLTNNS